MTGSRSAPNGALGVGLLGAASPRGSRALLSALLSALLLALLASPAGAHDREIATFALQPVAAKADGVEARGWVLEVHVARAALDAVLADGPAEAVDPKGWRARAVAYIKRHVRLLRGETSLNLGAGGIRVGGHQTDLRFLLPELPAAGGRLKVRIDAFSEDGHQSNVLKLRGSTPRTVVLTAENDFSVEIELVR